MNDRENRTARTLGLKEIQPRIEFKVRLGPLVGESQDPRRWVRTSDTDSTGATAI
jgi:hypothetical protein